jgi:type II secretory pathway predicted ATPase ExeA
VSSVDVRNPFTPGFGASPPVVVGRQSILAEVAEGYKDANLGHPTRKLLFRAHRGTGKTVLLNEVQDIATDRGWLVVQEDAGSTGTTLHDRLIDHLEQYLRNVNPPPKRRATGVSAPVVGGGLSWNQVDQPDRLRTLRTTLEAVLTLSEPPQGVLLAIDEIHDANVSELKELGNAIQHLDRDGRPIGVVLAGLPKGEDNPEDEPTFLTRCHQRLLEVIADDEVERGLVETAATVGWEFEPDGLAEAIHASAGYPYMMQLVGYEAFDSARSTSSGPITRSNVRAGVPEAQRRLSQSVLASLGQRLTDVELEFLLAMAVDPDTTRVGDIARRMGVVPQYVNVYRERLLLAGLIKQPARGYVDFAIPGHRGALRATSEYRARLAIRTLEIDRPNASGV